MSTASNKPRCQQIELLPEYALGALASNEMRSTQAHVAACSDCRRELESLRLLVDSFVFWPTDVLRPPASLWDDLVARISAETGTEPQPSVTRQWREPEWHDVAPGISCKVLASDAERHRVSMLVRLAPGTEYPPHTHAGVEELHLLHGELWIDDKKLYPGDYNRAEPGTADQRVWSQTGCTCVLMTSARDVLR